MVTRISPSPVRLSPSAQRPPLPKTQAVPVTETEIGDDGAAYGVEVRLGDNSEVEVNLDENCQVIGQEADDDGPNDKDGSDDQNDRSK